jgi:DNA segregation ATPase FtsK/SpoIIIE, S-DNA-T family
MAVSTRKTLASVSYKNEIATIILLAIAVILFLCLITFSPNDASVITSSSQRTKNLIGSFGSSVAALLLQALGITAYLVPALLSFIAWQIFRTKKIKVPFVRILGLALFVFAFSSLIMVSGFSHVFDGSTQSGGLIGVIFSSVLVPWLGKIGSFIVFVALSIVGFLLFTNWSLQFVFTQLREAFSVISLWIHQLKDYFENLKGDEDVSDTEVESNLKTDETPREKVSLLKYPSIIFDRIAAWFEKFTDEPEEFANEVDDEIEEIPVKKPVPTTKPVVALKDIIAEETIAAESAAEIMKPEPKPMVLEPIEITKKTPVEIKPNIQHENPFPIDGGISITPIKESGRLDESILDGFQNSSPDTSQSFDDYVLPRSEFLVEAPPRVEQKDEELLAIAQELTDKCKEFNVNGRVMHICQGPVVTTYEFKPDAGVKYSRVTGLGDDLCLALKAESIRIERIPGKAHVGIEVPNHNRETIFLREVIESKKFVTSDSKLTIALGKTIDGLNYVADLAKMPHLLIAGATGAGKSVGVNTLVVSILYKAKPDEVKFIMVDPKRLELGVYADIPHLATPIITDPKRATISLRWAVSEMERRYKELAGWGVRNIDGFNVEVKKKNAADILDENGEPWKTLPYIVIIIDELADLMMVAGKDVEESITRLAQMARAVGIHLVLATQRPSVDVITGLIKANFPARISFRVSSKIDSRTIIDGNGSEKLLGRGDMLFLPPATSQIIRVHGAYVDENEIHKIVEHVKLQGKPEYDISITKTEEEIEGTDGLPGKKDPLFWDAVKSVVAAKRASTSLLQRHLRIGYGRAAAILDAMVREGFIGEMDGSSRARPILERAYDALEAAESVEDF